jgi:hypothetical protein
MIQGKRNREADGRYRVEMPCDCCGKPVLDEHITDGDVCGNTDGPGFYLCGRARCNKRRDSLTVEQCRGLYTRQRAENETANAEGRKPRLVSLQGGAS